MNLMTFIDISKHIHEADHDKGYIKDKNIRNENNEATHTVTKSVITKALVLLLQVN